MKHWKCKIFLIAYGEMHDLLAWKRLAYLIKFLRIDFMDLLNYLKDLKMVYLDLWYLGKLIKNLLDKKWVLLGSKTLETKYIKNFTLYMLVNHDQNSKSRFRLAQSLFVIVWIELNSKTYCAILQSLIDQESYLQNLN